jgi:hypothetical protein
MQTDQEQLIPVVRAAAQLGISRQSLDARLRSRGIKPHRITKKGRVLVLLDQAQIRAAMQDQIISHQCETQKKLRADQPEGMADQLRPQPDRAEEGLIEAEPRAARAESGLIGADRGAERSQIAQERSKLLEEVQALQQRAMRAEAMLAAAERIERSTAARCDKLEGKLEAARLESAANAEKAAELRGQLQSQAFALAAQISPRGFRAALRALVGGS